jgi:DNA modification methylase
MTSGKGRVIPGNCFEVIDQFPDQHFHCIVTSPPYWRARNYQCEPFVFSNDAKCNHAFRRGEDHCIHCDGWHGILGMEPTIKLFIKNLMILCRKMKRVLRDDGVLWINIGDVYAQGGKRNTDSEQEKNKLRSKEKNYATSAFSGSRGWDRAAGTAGGVIREKSLTLGPERLAIALQEDGWIVRSRLWVKPNALSQSAADRPSPDYEHLWMLTKDPDYFYNREAVRKPARLGQTEEDYKGYLKTTWALDYLEDLWEITTQASVSHHSSTFPDELPRRCILLSTADMCCAKCGAPYEPLIEKGKLDLVAAVRMGGRKKDGGYDGVEQKDYKKLRAQEPSKTKARIIASLVKKNVVGWEKWCSCVFDRLEIESDEPTTVPCRVLDPFAGVGTTCYVGISEGRDCTGIELDPESFQVASFQVECAEAGLERKETNRLIKEIWPPPEKEDGEEG